jgi:hypothetical protein
MSCNRGISISISIVAVIVLTGCAHHALPPPIQKGAAPAAPPDIFVESVGSITNAAGQTLPIAWLVISNSTPTTLWFTGTGQSSPSYFLFEWGVRVEGLWSRTSWHGDINDGINSMHFYLHPGDTTRFTVGLGQRREFGGTDATVVALYFSAAPGGEALTVLTEFATTR